MSYTSLVVRDKFTGESPWNQSARTFSRCLARWLGSAGPFPTTTKHKSDSSLGSASNGRKKTESTLQNGDEKKIPKRAILNGTAFTPKYYRRNFFSTLVT